MIAPATNDVVQKLLLTAAEAAEALQICEKTLWTLTKHGGIPVVRLGKSVRYSPAALQKFIDEQQQTTASQLSKTSPQETSNGVHA